MWIVLRAHLPESAFISAHHQQVRNHVIRGHQRTGEGVLVIADGMHTEPAQRLDCRTVRGASDSGTKTPEDVGDIGTRRSFEESSGEHVGPELSMIDERGEFLCRLRLGFNLPSVARRHCVHDQIEGANLCR